MKGLEPAGERHQSLDIFSYVLPSVLVVGAYFVLVVTVLRIKVVFEFDLFYGVRALNL